MKTVELVKKVYEKPRALASLKILDFASVLICGAVLILTLAGFLTRGEWYSLFGAVITLGVPFVLVSILRRVLSFPRPFEIYGIPAERRGGGCSFPSRHAFSAFAIGTFICFTNVFWGIALLSLGALISVCRVLLGLHFWRDVIAGAVIGILGSLIGVLMF